MSIATKTGDKGDTSLMYGRRVRKTDPRVEAYGSLDELNAALGFARASTTDKFLVDQIHSIQKELIIVMGELATAPEDLARYTKDVFKLTTAGMVDRLTAIIVDLEKGKDFKDWAIPGEGLTSAALDLARTTCRRAERRVAQLIVDPKNFNGEILRYLNRLSDLCWLLARFGEKA